MQRIAAFLAACALAGGPASGAAQDNATGASSATPTVWDGLYSASQADRGRDAYNKACASCHMADLGGHEYAGALTGYPFQMKWEDASVAEVFGRIRSMPLGEPGSRSTQEYLDILAYVLQTNGYPAGRDDLTVGVAAQRWPRIKIERVK